MSAQQPTNISSERAKELALGGELDFQEIGFMCGLEIHQQLATRKLFSPCPSDVIDPDAVTARTIATFDRLLRATQSELGDIDAAALAEAKRQKRFQYLAIDGLTSLVEIDEEPPHPMSQDAMNVALQFCGLLGSRPAAEVHTMRKTVIDGSNTSGFQRTSLVATGGTVDVEPPVGIWTVALEEDSARKLDEVDGVVRYTLDRLGIPLIEVATAPDIVDPQHAQVTAARLGGLLRATGQVRRGLGSIRQDLNVSVGVGDRVEIKGCQDLRSVPQVIAAECRRQLWLHHIACELQDRGFQPDHMESPVDVSTAFAKTEAKMVASALKKGQLVWALALPKWAGLIGGAGKEHPRMGREFADHAKVAAGVKGIFHSDELPAYGIGDAEIAGVRQALGLGDLDGFVLCVANKRTAHMALEAVASRATTAVDAKVREVRAAQQDGTSRFMRPMPGAARMYPETDVPPQRIGTKQWEDVLQNLPLRPEEKLKLVVDAHGISEDLATQLLAEDQMQAFEELVAAKAEPALAARILLQYLPERSNPDSIAPRLAEVIGGLAQGLFAKEAIEAILEQLDKQPQMKLEEAVASAGAGAVDSAEVERIVADLVAQRMDFVKQRGMGAMGPLMGPVMAELRGKADGKVISDALQAELRKHI